MNTCQVKMCRFKELHNNQKNDYLKMKKMYKNLVNTNKIKCATLEAELIKVKNLQEGEHVKYCEKINHLQEKIKKLEGKCTIQCNKNRMEVFSSRNRYNDTVIKHKEMTESFPNKKLQK